MNPCAGFGLNFGELAGHIHGERRIGDCLVGGRSVGTSRGSDVGVGVLASSLTGPWLRSVVLRFSP